MLMKIRMKKEKVVRLCSLLQMIMLTRKKNDQQIALPLIDEAPEMYLPGLQFFIRLMLGIVSLGYFSFLPTSPLILSYIHILLVLSLYIVFHLCWWRLYKRYGISMIMIRIGSWVDIIVAFLMVCADSSPIPPMFILYVIAVMGNGIQHGLYISAKSMYGALILGTAGLVVHFILLGIYPPYNMYFYVLLIILAIYYS